MDLSAHIDLVKDQIRYHQRMLAEGDPGRINPYKHRALVTRWEALLETLVSLHEVPVKPSVENAPKSLDSVSPTIVPQSTQTSFSDLSGLPPDLLKELGATETLQKDQQVIDVIKAAGGTASISEILVGLFRMFQIVEKRRLLNARLYSMEKRRNLIKSVPGKKGTYTLVI